MASVYVDGEYFGSIIDSNMLLHEGLLTIGKSELMKLPLGASKLLLAFDDGDVELTIYITDTENEPPGEIGDADLDGEVTILDATLIQRYLVDLDPLTKIAQYLADTDGDGEITVLDATLIQRYLAGLTTM